jgi:hypothetical protein
MHRRPAILLAFCVLACARPAGADLILTLAPSVQNGASGTELVFSGTLLNTSTTAKVFLNDITFTPDGASAASLTLKPNDFFANVPGILLPGETYGGTVFRVALSAGAPAGDYGGTITLVGGTDIFAASNLASAAFAVRSPEIDLAATDASASESGPDPGTFTISRTGATDLDLTVAYAISGTAVNGSDYQTIPGTITLASGSSSATVTITPIPDTVADGDRTVVLTLTASSAYNLGSGLSDTVTIHDRPIDAWRLQEFGSDANNPAIAGDLAAPAQDGIPNLIKYALGAAPLIPASAILPLPAVSLDPADGQPHLTLTATLNPAATDVTVSAEVSSDLLAWNSGPGYTEVVSDTTAGGVRTLIIRDTVPLGTGSSRFMRLKVISP